MISMKTPSSYQVECLDTLAQLDTLEKEWGELIAGIPAAPVFLSWEWIRTWWVHYGRNRELWLLTVRNEQGHLLGIAPLMKEVRKTGWMKLRFIAFLGTDRDSEVHNDVLVHASDAEGLTQAFLDFLFNRSDQWDVISLASVAQESALYRLLAAAAGRLRTGSKTTSVYIPLPGNWETYLKILAKKLRRNLKYFSSKLENDHPRGVIFECLTDPRELPEAMKRLEELNKNRWHEMERISNFDYLNYSTFHQAIAGLALERGWLRLYQLKVLGRVIGMCYNYRFHDRVYAYAVAFDLAWSGYSPGRLAIAKSIQASIEETAGEYDWGAGDHAYKFAWTDQARVENEILFSNHWRGIMWLELKSFFENSHEGLITMGRRWLPQSLRDRINQFLSPRYRNADRGDEKDAG
jgi:CelD/BcsL family acetyltransferase involved in cellulose biosynthesis